MKIQAVILWILTQLADAVGCQNFRYLGFLSLCLNTTPLWHVSKCKPLRILNLGTRWIWWWTSRFNLFIPGTHSV